MRYSGVTAKGIITPIFRYGDNVIEGIVDSLISASEHEGFGFSDGDILASPKRLWQELRATMQPASR